MQYKYSPGLLGYGMRGLDGSSGFPGISLYFTNLNDPQDFEQINTIIKNNLILYPTNELDRSLPRNRTYINGDMFLTPMGYVYEITNTLTGAYKKTDGYIRRQLLFEKSNPISLTSIGYTERWLNKNDTKDNRYIIDNNFSNKSNYLNNLNIYGIDIKEYTRIEYTDLSAFTLYSTGQNPIDDNHKALALIKTDDGFSIGNIDNNNKNRNTNICFDVSSLIFKNKNTKIESSIGYGTILTNREKNANTLFDSDFNENPESFFVNIVNNISSKIHWNLRDFTKDVSVSGTIMFSVAPNLLNTNINNITEINPIIFHNVDVSGNIIITNLIEGAAYHCCVIIEKNGWERRSVYKTVFQTNVPVALDILRPSSLSISADASGWFALELGIDKYKHVIDISTNSITGFTAQLTDPTNTWINIINGFSTQPGNHLFDVSLNRNITQNNRSGNIIITSQAAPRIISVNQSREERYVSFDSTGKIVFTPPLTDQTVNITIETGAWAAAQGRGGEGRAINIVTELWRKNAGLWTRIPNDAQATAASFCFIGGCNQSFDRTINSFRTTTNTFNIDSNIDVSINIKSRWRRGSDWEPFENKALCNYTNENIWFQSIGYAFISSINWTSGTGAILFDTNRCYLWSSTFPLPESTTCTTIRGAFNTRPTINAHFP